MTGERVPIPLATQMSGARQVSRVSGKVEDKKNGEEENEKEVLIVNVNQKLASHLESSDERVKTVNSMLLKEDEKR